MRFRYFILLFQLVLFCQAGICQKKEKAATRWETGNDDNPNNLNVSRFQINDIKTRGIIVRLKTDKDRIAAYRNAGNTKVANKLEEKTKTAIKVMEYAYITNWSYSPVYFMESQNTATLMQKDTLIAKTYDLKRDTSIYMNHDSVYFVDYSQLIESDYEGAKASNPSNGSGAAESGWFMVVKDHELNQLQNPMPYKAKLWGDGFMATDKLLPIEIDKDMQDSISVYLSQYPDMNSILHSPAKKLTLKYLARIFEHVNIAETVDSSQASASVARKKLSLNEEYTTTKKVWGDPYTQAALRLNKHFIAYYCKRLDKDKNLLSSDDLLYWWQKNPNIRYLPSIHNLEVELKQLLDINQKFTPVH